VVSFWLHCRLACYY